MATVNQNDRTTDSSTYFGSVDRLNRFPDPPCNFPNQNVIVNVCNTADDLQGPTAKFDASGRNPQIPSSKVHTFTLSLALYYLAKGRLKKRAM